MKEKHKLQSKIFTAFYSFIIMQILHEIKPHTTVDTLVNYIQEKKTSQENHAMTRSSNTIG